jgi:predicted transcriptional regulator
MAKDHVKEVLDRVLTWPRQLQEEAAQMLLLLEAREDEAYRPSDDEWTAVAEGLAQAKQGETVSDDEIAALFKPHGP